MGEFKQAKVLNNTQQKVIYDYLLTTTNPIRNVVIFYLSSKAGLRAIEIASLQWNMVTDAEGNLTDYISLPNSATKGQSGGRSIPIHKQLKSYLEILLEEQRKFKYFNPSTSFVITTQRSPFTSAQSIVNMFQRWYKKIGMIGCSSHSGRRTFITNCSRKISTVGGSLRDVQYLSGHSSLQTTQRYIEGDSESKRKVVELI